MGHDQFLSGVSVRDHFHVIRLHNLYSKQSIDNWPTPRSRIFIEKLMVAGQENAPLFDEPEDSLSCSHSDTLYYL
jgi:hypothetical protein